ncbi:hypothetical protein B0H63DRAFT_510115 [Podospora didyma]|uniref:Uncharacterized protein n=1 Tax=Podospora didyma TaxID=330526 RepID=A0AAE0NPC4_9PEZI|nr:hypothetical protein B0H63DRAFT_510115 [Podospora didyma]
MKFTTAFGLGVACLASSALANITIHKGENGAFSVVSTPNSKEEAHALRHKKKKRTGCHNNGGCHEDNCFRAMLGRTSIASEYCATFTTAPQTATTDLGSFETFCASDPKRISSACSCLVKATQTSSSSLTIESSSVVSSTTESSTAESSTTESSTTESSTTVSTVKSSTTSTSSTSSVEPTPTTIPCNPPGGHCTIDNFITACCKNPDGSVGCYFPGGDPYDGTCFL